MPASHDYSKPGKYDSGPAKTPTASDWWHEKELQALRKMVVLHSQDLERVFSAVHGLGEAVTKTTSRLQCRVEALEARNVSMACTGQLGAEAKSLEDLEAHYEHGKKNAATQIDRTMAEMNDENLEQDSSEGFFLADDLRTCLVNASNHVMKLEMLSRKWQDLQASNVCCGCADNFEENVQKVVLKCLRKFSRQTSLHAATSSANLIVDESGIIDLDVRQHVKQCGKMAKQQKAKVAGMQRSTVPSLCSLAEVELERRRSTTDQTSPLPSGSTPESPTMSASLDGAAAAPLLPDIEPYEGLRTTLEPSAHISSPTLDAVEPAPPAAALLPGTSATSMAAGSSCQSCTVPASDTSSIKEALGSKSVPLKPCSFVVPVVQSPRVHEQHRLCIPPAGAMSIKTPRTFSPGAPPRATLLLQPHVTLSALRCEVPPPCGMQMQLSPRSTGGKVVSPVSACRVGKLLSPQHCRSTACERLSETVYG